MAIEKKVTLLEDINDETKSWNIKVKVLLLWKKYYSKNPTKVSSIDMILMDEKVFSDFYNPINRMFYYC